MAFSRFSLACTRTRTTPEPGSRARRRFTVLSDQLVLVPAVGFDTRGVDAVADGVPVPGVEAVSYEPARGFDKGLEVVLKDPAGERTLLARSPSPKNEPMQPELPPPPPWECSGIVGPSEGWIGTHPGFRKSVYVPGRLVDLVVG